MNNFVNEQENCINLAQQSKESFIKFISVIGISQVVPWVKEWLELYWTDEKSRMFFEKYWNGALDTNTLLTEQGEFPSLLDDIEKCMIDF